MERLMLKIFLLFAIALGFMACAHGQCNNVPQRPPASDDAGTPASGAVAAAPTPVAVIPPDSVQVFKTTGEKQCETGKGTPPGVTIDELQTTLTSKKITVFESHTQSDGKMHMELCGSPSGTVHVFTI